MVSDAKNEFDCRSHFHHVHGPIRVQSLSTTSRPGTPAHDSTFPVPVLTGNDSNEQNGKATIMPRCVCAANFADSA